MNNANYEFSKLITQVMPRDESGARAMVKRLWREADRDSKADRDGFTIIEAIKIMKTVNISRAYREGADYLDTIKFKEAIRGNLIYCVGDLDEKLNGFLGLVCQTPLVVSNESLAINRFVITIAVRKGKIRKHPRYFRTMPLVPTLYLTKHYVQRFFQRAKNNKVVDLIKEVRFLEGLHNMAGYDSEGNRIVNSTTEATILPSHTGLSMFKMDDKEPCDCDNPLCEVIHQDNDSIAITYISEAQLFDAQLKTLSNEDKDRFKRTAYIGEINTIKSLSVKVLGAVTDLDSFIKIDNTINELRQEDGVALGISGWIEQYNNYKFHEYI